MKRTILCLFSLANLGMSQAQEKPFTLMGKIKGQSSGYIRLFYSVGEEYKKDSAAIINGAFRFKGTLIEPTMAYIMGGTTSPAMGDPNTASFFIEPQAQEIELIAGDFANLKVTGSKTQLEYQELERLKKKQKEKLKPISAAYNKANMEYMAAVKAKEPEVKQEALKAKATAIKDQMDPYYEEIGRIDNEYVRTHPDSYLTAYSLRFRISQMKVDEAKAVYENLTPRIKESSNGKLIAEEIKKLEAGSSGAVASLFSTSDINGQPLSLADFKGKNYVLLDFWASWCVPCRKGNPHLLSLYRKYKDKGLEIVGVSDDDSNLEAWRKAIDKDEIGVWKHVLRGLKRTSTGFDRSNDISEAYGIHSLPTKILIDKDGIIVGRYGGGGENDEAMEKKLAEIFN
ncbi:TlpA disulfide reductase family protein [Desertivirga arenae]|uniref:TlpA disulfide reductase family protein n=1 Tax=Desertivirga arenae TaxID=2810309 RepID=UPI001A97B42F|nr:TlpA disulfide reductase family protein [Pedobacter sp. SYSU D00823]